MRKLSLGSILLVSVLMALSGLMAFGIIDQGYRFLAPEMESQSGTSFLGLFAGFIFFYLFIILFYRLFIYLSPLNEGEILEGSRHQFIYDVHALFFIIFFHPFTRSKILPLPLYNLFYKLLGAQLGSNTFPSGLLFDPCFIEIGDNGIIGDGSRLVPHIMEKNRLAHYRIKIGNNVTIGMNSSILGGVIIEDGAVVGANSLVAKHTHIKSGEVWAGIPAKPIKSNALSTNPIASEDENRVRILAQHFETQ